MYRKTIAEVVKEAAEECRDARINRITDACEAFGGQSELERRFGRGSFGAHEATDRIHVVLENLETYLLGSPTVCVVEDAHDMVHLAGLLLMYAYQKVSAYSDGDDHSAAELMDTHLKSFDAPEVADEHD